MTQADQQTSARDQRGPGATRAPVTAPGRAAAGQAEVGRPGRAGAPQGSTPQGGAPQTGGGPQTGAPRTGAPQPGARQPRFGQRPGQPRAGRGPAPRGPRSARLVLRRVEPWSVLRMSLVMAVAGVVAAIVFVSLLYGALHAMGVFDSVGTFSNDIGATSTAKLITFRTVIGWTALISSAVAVFGAAVVTVVAFVYNAVNEYVGGPEITFTERG